MFLATSFNSFLTLSTTGGGVGLSGLSGLFGVFGLHLEAASGNITGSVNKLAKAYNAFLFFCFI